MEHYDCVGTEWINESKLFDPDLKDYKFEINPHYSGNFWWADTNYIKTLSNVLDRSLYYDEKFTEQFDGHRFCYEIWISSNKPKVRSIHYSAVDHYYALYPRERYAN